MISIRPSRWQRRAAIALVTAALVASCGSSDDSADPAVDTGSPVDAVDEGTDEAAPATAATTAATTAAPPAVASGKPEVVVPEQIPTDLVVTDLVDGDGPTAEIGDTVVVDYVGVRTEDGFEFDNSYDRGEPFPVVVGTGGVIQGWDLGLVGARAGMRRQLDIPADLAYGDADRGDIRPGDALTFVVDIREVQKRPVVTAPPRADDAACAVEAGDPQQQTFTEMQPFCIDVTKTYTAEIVTNFGPMTVELLPEKAPQNVNNFVMLARHKYFDGTECHRVLTDFVVQCGDPQADGYGGPGYTIPDELPLPGEYLPGSIAMANTGAPNSAGSQFFIISGANGASLPPQYSLFGETIGGLDTTIAELNTLENPNGDNGTPPLETITIESVTITES